MDGWMEDLLKGIKIHIVENLRNRRNLATKTLPISERKKFRSSYLPKNASVCACMHYSLSWICVTVPEIPPNPVQP